MTIRIGINGAGRIGRAILRASRMDPLFADLAIVAINDPAPREVLAHLIKHDSVMGAFPGDPVLLEEGLQLADQNILLTHAREPGEINWGRVGADYVIEASGRFTRRDAAENHFKGGARRVVITAPAKGEVKTLVMGVNEEEYDPRHHTIVSNASCTTNCLAPMARVVMERFGLERGLMTTVHAVTNDQRLLDAPHTDLRRARAAGVSIIPTSTGAAAAIGLVIPALTGRFDGLSVRVPTPNVSLVDAVMELGRDVSVDELNQAFREAQNRYLGYCDEPLVSVDYQGNPHSGVVDGDSTRAIGSTVKVLTWYDNEWGYANRVLDLIRHMDRAAI
ncbi:MAG: type I glyceraldehyde-3-phosphate dehydrogenase [Magnetococcales bacterium]|nr:type I glyceraldehyde-3-phosphate dehydrogenase [Magnetococcales bacterium]